MLGWVGEMEQWESTCKNNHEDLMWIPSTSDKDGCSGLCV